MKKTLTTKMKTFLTFVVGIITLLLGAGLLIYNYIVNLDVPYFAIPLVLCIPVIVAVTFRVIIDENETK